MDRGRARIVSANTEHEVRELLEHIDIVAQSQEGRWAEKRGNYRRQFQTECDVRHVAADGKSVVTTSGMTRDVSAGGLGFVAPQHFLRRTELLALVKTADGNVKRLTGHVVYSRRAEEGWYLTGMKFGPVDNAALSRDASAISAPAETRVGRATPKDSRPVRVGNPDPPVTKRQRELGILAAAGAARTHSKECVARVVVLSLSPDHEVRRAAIPVLMQIGGQDGIASLIGLLDDCNPTIQGEAADALGQIRAVQAVGPLRRLLHHQDEDIALRAAEALARAEDRSGLRVVLRVLWNDAPRNRRAARALGVMVGQDFRPNPEGVAAARRYAKASGL